MWQMPITIKVKIRFTVKKNCLWYVWRRGYKEFSVSIFTYQNCHHRHYAGTVDDVTEHRLWGLTSGMELHKQEECYMSRLILIITLHTKMNWSGEEMKFCDQRCVKTWLVYTVISVKHEIYPYLKARNIIRSTRGSRRNIWRIFCIPIQQIFHIHVYLENMSEVRKIDQKYQESFEMWFWRMPENIRRTDHVRN